MAALDDLGDVTARSPIIRSAPVGPAQRRFANAACILESAYGPKLMLSALKRLEGHFGRRNGQRWGDRVLDCDIILWNGGGFSSCNLTIPHPEFRSRNFVLDPACAIAPDWRDPVTGLTIRHLAHRLRHR